MFKSTANRSGFVRMSIQRAQETYWPLAAKYFKGFFVPLLILVILPYLVQDSQALGDECHLRPVIHVLRHPGCVPKPIPSFACQGTCSSYVQVSASRFWQVERSCMCCQEMGEREATVGIFCPKATPRFRKIITRAPVDCMCRPCTAVDESSVLPELEARLTESNEVRDISVI